MQSNDNNPSARWDRGNLEEWRATLPGQRREEDIAKLSHVFNLAAKVPELKKALEWAKDHGIDFIVDHTAKAGGYYTVGTGVVAIVDSSFIDDGYAVGVITHEIRHAWQDWYGMIPTTGKSFTDYYMRLSVIEADAMAHETVAQNQHRFSKAIEHWSKSEDSQQQNMLTTYERMMRDSDAPWALWNNFRSWYDTRASYYGAHAVKVIGHKLGIPGVAAPDISTEYQPYKNRPVPMIEGLDVMDPDQLRRLGKGFSGRNYFNKASHDVLARKILSPGRASTLYKSMHKEGNNVERNPVIDEMRRRELRLKRHLGKAVLL